MAVCLYVWKCELYSRKRLLSLNFFFVLKKILRGRYGNLQPTMSAVSYNLDLSPIVERA